MNVYILSVDSEEYKVSTYKAVDLNLNGKFHKRFDSGIPQEDYNSAINHIIKKEKSISDCHIMHSSSVDHFIMDGGKLKA